MCLCFLEACSIKFSRTPFIRGTDWATRCHKGLCVLWCTKKSVFEVLGEKEWWLPATAMCHLHCRTPVLPNQACVCVCVRTCHITHGSMVALFQMACFSFRPLPALVVFCVMVHYLLWFQSVVMILLSHFDIYLSYEGPLLGLTVTSLWDCRLNSLMLWH